MMFLALICFASVFMPPLVNLVIVSALYFLAWNIVVLLFLEKPEFFERISGFSEREVYNKWFSFHPNRMVISLTMMFVVGALTSSTVLLLALSAVALTSNYIYNKVIL